MSLVLSRQRIRLLLKRPPNSGTSWSSLTREASIAAVDVIKWRTMSHPVDGESILIEVAQEAEAVQLRNLFPAIETLPPTERPERDPNCLVVVQPRLETPTDQLLATMNRLGRVVSHKTLPAKTGPHTRRPPLHLFELEDPIAAQRAVAKQFVIVKGDKLLCRAFYTGDKDSRPTELPERFHAWLFGVPGSFRDVDIASLAQVHGAVSWVMRRTSSGQFAIQCDFRSAEDRQTMTSGAVNVSGRQLRWLMAPPCLRCGLTDHTIKDCQESPPARQAAPANGPAPKRPRSYREAVRVEQPDLTEIIRAEVSKATQYLLQAIQERDKIIFQLIQQIGLKIDPPAPLPDLLALEANIPAEEPAPTFAGPLTPQPCEVTAAPMELEAIATSAPAEDAPRGRSAALRAREKVAAASKGAPLPRQ